MRLKITHLIREFDLDWRPTDVNPIFRNIDTGKNSKQAGYVRPIWNRYCYTTCPMKRIVWSPLLELDSRLQLAMLRFPIRMYSDREIQWIVSETDYLTRFRREVDPQ